MLGEWKLMQNKMGFDLIIKIIVLILIALFFIIRSRYTRHFKLEKRIIINGDVKETVNQLKDNGFSINKICKTLGINRSLYYRKEKAIDRNYNHPESDDMVLLKQIL